jgi:hypothetical protein
MPVHFLSLVQIKCVSTGHEMPNKLEIVQQYANGKKYKMAVRFLATLNFPLFLSPHPPY